MGMINMDPNAQWPDQSQPHDRMHGQTADTSEASHNPVQGFLLFLQHHKLIGPAEAEKLGSDLHRLEMENVPLPAAVNARLEALVTQARSRIPQLAQVSDAVQNFYGGMDLSDTEVRRQHDRARNSYLWAFQEEQQN